MVTLIYVVISQFE